MNQQHRHATPETSSRQAHPDPFAFANHARRTAQCDAKRSLPALIGIFALSCCAAHAMPNNAGAVVSSVNGTLYRLGNAAIEETFSVKAGRLSGVSVIDREHERTIHLPEAFELMLQNGQKIPASAMQIVAPPSIEALPMSTTAAQAAQHRPGKQICTQLREVKGNATARWCVVMRDGARFLRQTLTLNATGSPLPIGTVQLLAFHDSDARMDGTVAGSPVVDRTTFFGFEHPLSSGTVSGGNVALFLKRVLPLRPGRPVTYSSVIGISDPGQMRRSFLAYLGEERAHPYRTFLTYNTWYDLGDFNRYSEAGVLNRIHAFGEELHRKRGVQLDSFLFDDGWDDENSLWHFDAGFPDGFTRAHQAAAAYGAGIGVWLSPWGGYGQPKQQRLAFGRKAGYEIVNGGFALSGPRYFKFFEQTCRTMISKYGVNQFKIDGTGNVSQVVPGSAFDSDFNAALYLIAELRQQEPNVFINLTTGTYASPFWLRYADTIWRGGDDHSFAGVGTWRQKWITYRDAQTYKNVVVAGPLYPLNSLMLHGMIYAQKTDHLATDPGNDFADEVWSYFGSGTQLQEMYITPSLLSARNWDTLAAAAKWSRSNSATLRDTHWIGGDPAKLQVYGWASWSPTRALVTLRNPSAHAQQYMLDAQAAFQLPQGAPRHFRLESPRGAEAGLPHELSAGAPQQITLQPYEVLVAQASPIE